MNTQIKTRISEIDAKIEEDTTKISTLQATLSGHLTQSVAFLQEEFQKKFDEAKNQLIATTNAQLQQEAAVLLANISALEIEKGQLTSKIAEAATEILTAEETPPKELGRD